LHIESFRNIQSHHIFESVFAWDKRQEK
jgi:hypothetical protein